MEAEDGILKIDEGIFKEKESILGEFIIKIQLRESLDVSVNGNIISISAKNIHNNELIVYEKILNNKNFKSLGKLFELCENIEQVYESLCNLIENNGVKINEIDDKNFITLSVELPIPILNKTLSAFIKLLRRD
eukprot:jgi/Orpsp1_1/1184072/evm.model.c7180000087882.1